MTGRATAAGHEEVLDMLKIQEDKTLGGGSELVVVDRRLYLTAERDRLVEEGDPDGRILYCTAGKRAPRKQLEALGATITDPDAIKRDKKAAAKAAAKAAKKTKADAAKADAAKAAAAEAEKAEAEAAAAAGKTDGTPPADPKTGAAAKPATGKGKGA